MRSIFNWGARGASHIFTARSARGAEDAERKNLFIAADPGVIDKTLHPDEKESKKYFTGQGRRQ
jgi:hypothetical protein